VCEAKNQAAKTPLNPVEQETQGEWGKNDFAGEGQQTQKITMREKNHR